MQFSIEEQFESFVNKNFNQLSLYYPGLTHHYIKREFKEYCHDLNISLTSFNDERVDNFLESLLSGVPVSYIRGKHFFYNHDFDVCEEVLIPRQETEILVEKVIEIIKKNNLKSVCDVGCGSGCIGISIAAECSKLAQVTLTDISQEALEVARSNYWKLRYNIDNQIQLKFCLSERLSKVEEKFDLIVSNPPYIKRRKDYSLVHSQVLKYEPHLALFLEDDEYDRWFSSFFDQVYDHLGSKGFFLMEGHEHHLDSLKGNLIEKGFQEVKVIQDLTGSNRFLIGQKYAKPA